MEDNRLMQYIRSVKQNPENIKKINKEILIEYPQICLELIKAFPKGIKYIPMEVREDIPQVCIDAVEANPKNIKYVPEQVQRDNYQMCLNVIKKSKGLLYYISIDILEEHPEICLEALLRDEECIEDIPEEIIESTPQIQVMLEIMKDWKKIEDLPIEMLRSNPQLCIKASILSKKKYQLPSYTPSKEVLLNNSELVDKYIKEWRELVKSVEKKYIVETKDPEYIKKCIKNKEQYITVRNNYNYAIYELVKAIDGNEQETIMELLEQKDEYNLTNDEIISVISLTKDDSFIKSFIEKRDEYEFSTDNVALLIRSTGDTKFIEQCIIQPEIYGLGKETAKELLFYTNDIPFVINYIKENPSTDSEMKKIKLPKGMTIGIEIETEGNGTAALLQESELLDGWKTKQDKSLEDGVEVISPVLKNEANREQEIYDICSILRLCKNYESERCGGHVHIGAGYLKSVDAWKNLIELWSNTENIMYLICNKEGQLPREKIKYYALPISNKIANAIEKGEVDFEDEEDIELFCWGLQELQGGRYFGINFQNFGKEEKNTIEFRISNGTISPDTWIENINLYGGIIAASQELAEIQQKLENGIEITDDEQRKLDAFEIIKNTDYEKQKLKCLLYLAIDEKERQIYFNRYDENLDERLGFELVKDAGHIKINRKKIGKIAFTGNDRVTGEDFQQGSAIIKSELDRENRDSINHDISK